MTQTASFGDMTVTLNKKYNVENIKKFIVEVTSGKSEAAEYREDPIATLGGLGIEVGGDIELTREKALRAMGENGFPGVLDGDLSTSGSNALIGPAIVFVIIVLYPR